MDEQLIFLGLLATAGFAAGSLAELVRLPRVGAYVLVGILFSEPLAGSLVPGGPGDWIAAITGVALGMIAFLVGSEMDLSELRHEKRQIAGISLGQGLGAATAVVLVLTTFSAFVPGQLGGLGWTGALILAALAIASGPAALIAVIAEDRARGPLTQMLLPALAISDALSIMVFTAVIGITGEAALPIQIGNAATEIGLAVALGLAFGGLLGLFGRHIHRGSLRLPLIIAVVILNAGLSERLGYSDLLGAIVMGLTAMLVFRGPQREWIEPMNHVRDTIFLLFFTLAGTHFELAIFASALPLILLFVASRLVGKIAGANAGAAIAGAAMPVRRWSGFALAPQAGVAIGLALRVGANPQLERVGDLILNVVVGSTIMFELAAPLLARMALARAGEISAGGQPRERNSEFRQRDPHREAEGAVD